MRTLIAILAATTALAASADPTPAELAQQLQRRYDGIKDFSANFVHAYVGGALRKRVTEQGHVVIKKPGRMRWDYTTPEAKVFVADGVKVYSYVPADKQVVVSPVPAEDEATTPTLFLAGKGNLTRDFTVSAIDLPNDMPAGSRTLKLVPHVRQQDYDWLVLVVDPSTLALRGFVTEDAQGGTSSFLFANLKENTGIADKAFEFKIPRGVDVISTGAR
jgi:outer membrane lipoprotein carrier protein